MRGKYSPTILERYVDRQWWFRNGGGYGLLADGTQMSETYHSFDHEGFDQFGYGREGHDRAGYSIRDYEGSEELFSEIANEFSGMKKAGKSVDEYWTALRVIVDAVNDRFSDLPLVHPQEDLPDRPYLALRSIAGSSYGIDLRLEDIDGMARSLEISFDDGTGGSSRQDITWTVHVVETAGGQKRRNAICMMEAMDAALEFAVGSVKRFDPDRNLYDVYIAEGGDGVVYLDAVQRNDSLSGDFMACLCADDRRSAIEKFASRFEEGGVISRMAERGIRRLCLMPDQPSIAPLEALVKDHPVARTASLSA